MDFSGWYLPSRLPLLPERSRSYYFPTNFPTKRRRFATIARGCRKWQKVRKCWNRLYSCVFFAIPATCSTHRAENSGAVGREFESLRARHPASDPSLRSGFRPHPLRSPAERLKFESLRARRYPPARCLQCGFLRTACHWLSRLSSRTQCSTYPTFSLSPCVLTIPAAS
jgi:hypothetical protein